MSKILAAIPQQGFELVRDRIGAILATELAEQSDLNSDTNLDADVWVSRSTPFDAEELPAVNVVLAEGDYDNKHQGSSRGTYQYNIEVYTKAKSGNGKDGDKESSLKLDRLVGVCRAILENPVYKRLDFDAPFISHTMVTGFQNGRVDAGDARYNVMGLIRFNVVLTEDTQLLEGLPVGSLYTTVKLYETDKGYLWTDIFQETPLVDIFDNTFDATFN